ncbi:anti-sigma factor [Lewinella sp. LCG006]|uniref:anti-sigma factor n=1 Tax=Lewinella sp. LCG006 TaxID=3231911 RepID=UPI0034606A9E
MDIKAYIASGILEQYAFDLLSPTERSEVEAHLQQYPELVEELRQIEYAIEKYLSLYQDTPSPDFKQRLNDSLENVVPDPRPTPPPPPSSRGGFNGWLMGLAIIALAAAAWLFYDNQEKDRSYQELAIDYQNLQLDCDETTETNRGLLNQLQTIRQSGNSLIQMRGTDKDTTAFASIIYNAETRKSYLDIINLATPAADKQYQLWAIVDGTPVDMGVFDVTVDTSSTLQEVPFIENVQAFAVTLEPRGGSVVPTLEEMVVIGTTG